MSRINSRAKGAAGELEFANILKDHGYSEARRGQQYNGIEGEDVIGLPNIHIEVKRVEKLNLYDAIDQSIRDAAEGEIPIVAHRKNRQDWQISMRLKDWRSITKISRQYIGDLKVGQVLHLDSNMKKAKEKAKIAGTHPILIHGRDTKDLYITVLFKDWIEEFKAYEEREEDPAE